MVPLKSKNVDFRTWKQFKLNIRMNFELNFSTCVSKNLLYNWIYYLTRRADVKPNRMYLHAHRLVLPNSIEPLDLDAGDPFIGSSSSKPIHRDDQDSSSTSAESNSSFYKETETVHVFDSSVYDVFEDETLPWQTLPSSTLKKSW
jgi:hypothetical protein